MIYLHFVCFFICPYDHQKKGFAFATGNKRESDIMSSTQNYMSSQSLSENHIQDPARSSEGGRPEQEAKELLDERVAVETKSKGMFGNFLTIASQKTYELYLSIIGDYHYLAKNEFSYKQKVKILSFLQSKVLTINAQVEDQERIRFADFDPEYLAKLPQDFEQLRNRILKGRTNLDAAKQSLERVRYSSQHLKAKYLNEQAFEFQRMKNNSICWGLLFGALISATIYRRANIVRKTALFVTLGHVFGVASHRFNIDRYFDSVYPIFREQAIEFAKQEKEEFQDWKPEGKAVIED